MERATTIDKMIYRAKNFRMVAGRKWADVQVYRLGEWHTIDNVKIIIQAAAKLWPQGEGE